MYCQYTILYLDNKELTIRFSLKDALSAYEAKTGIRLTYEELSNLSGVSVDTLKSIANRAGYNATFQTVSAIGNSMHIDPIKFMTWS